nr:hypothetical protein [Tanacetum cinerariifolium]
EVGELKQDIREVLSKVIPYVALELLHRDDIGSLVGKLVSSAIVYGRCRDFEQVAGMKEPFDLSKVKGYCSSYKILPPLPTLRWMSLATPSSVPAFNLMSPPADASVVKPQSSPPQ